MSHNITVQGGTSVRLPTAGKYCDRDILITAEGGAEDLDTELTEQEALIQQLKLELAVKAYGGGLTHDDIAIRNISGDVTLSVESIYGYSFYGCTNITSLNAPNVTAVGDYGCYACRALESLSIPNVTSVGQYAFTQCYKLPILDAPNLTTMGTGAFGGSATYKMAFKSVYLPKLTAVPNSAMTYFVNVTELVLPECTSVGNSSLTNWTNLAYVDLPKCTSIVNYGLRNNSKLETLILRSETMCTLSNYALNSTKIFNGTGYVYVPRALVESYQVATNWKTAYGKNADTFRALEDYTVDGTLTGALDDSKI